MSNSLWLNRVRPKLLAIEVSGCHLVPVIVQASGRGRQARAGGHGQRDVTQPQDLGQGRYRKVIPDHRPDRHRRGRTLLMAVPPNAVTGPGSGGRPVNHLGQVTVAHLAWS